MKKLVVSILTILSSKVAYALPVGNPAEASLFFNGLLWDSGSSCNPCDPCFSCCHAWSFRLGYYGDFVFDRKWKALFDKGTSSPDGTHRGRHLQKTRLITNAAYFDLNICNRVDLFATVGATHLNFRTNENVFQMVGTGETALSVGEAEFNFRDRFSWSIGARATLWECYCFALGIEGQYFNAHPELDYYVHFATGSKTYFDNVQGCYNEWQFGIGVSYRIATNCPSIAFTPYVAGKWSRGWFNLQRTLVDPETNVGVLNRFFVINKFRTAQSWAGALGVTFTLCDASGVTVEGRWGDETALYVNGQVRF